ncbi:MAG: winged helix-turn-helix transcriptional regulator [Candidatus Helarchaeota archaeon]
MDQLEKKILNELILNSRQSWSSLSKKLNISVNVLKNRIQKLEDEVIEGYITELNAKYYMEGFLFVYLKLSSLKTKEIQRVLMKLNQLNYLYLIQDLTNNFAFFYEFSTINEKKQLLDYLESMSQISSIETFQFSYSRQELPRNIGDHEWKIIYNLRDNSRMAGTKLAKITGLSANKVNNTIKNLIQDEILFFTVKLNPNKIKENMMCFLLIRLAKFEEKFYHTCLNIINSRNLFNPPIIPFNNPPAFLINLLGNIDEIQNIINQICNSPLIKSYQNIIWKEYRRGYTWQDIILEKKARELNIFREIF